jgi:hypothetical protein
VELISNCEPFKAVAMKTLMIILSYASWSAYEPDGYWIIIGTPHPAGSQFYPFITMNAGIRVQSENGFIFRLGFTPLIQVTTLYPDSKIFFPWAGISFGYSF